MILRPSHSTEHLSSVFYQVKPPPEQIPEDEGENLNSMMCIKIESGRSDDQVPKTLSRLKQSDSICMEGYDPEEEGEEDAEEGEYGDFEFKIEVKGEGHIDAGELAAALLETAEDESGVYDLSLLRIEARKDDFRGYLERTLEHIYKLKDYSFAKCVKLLNMITEEYQWSERLNKEAVAIFKRLQAFKNIDTLSFSFREALPVSLLFSDTLEQHYHHFVKVITHGLNSLEVFPRLKFTEQVVGADWKERILEQLILEKIEAVRACKERMGLSTSEGEHKKILKELEMEQLKISVLVDENESLIRRLESRCHHLHESTAAHDRSLADILKMSLSAIRYNM